MLNVSIKNKGKETAEAAVIRTVREETKVSSVVGGVEGDNDAAPLQY